MGVDMAGVVGSNEGTKRTDYDQALKDVACILIMPAGAELVVAGV